MIIEKITLDGVKYLGQLDKKECKIKNALECKGDFEDDLTEYIKKINIDEIEELGYNDQISIVTSCLSVDELNTVKRYEEILEEAKRKVEGYMLNTIFTKLLKKSGE